MMEKRTVTSDHWDSDRISQIHEHETGDALRRSGRPRKPEAERLVPVSTNVSAALYAMLCRLARHRGMTVAALVRERIIAQK